MKESIAGDHFIGGQFWFFYSKTVNFGIKQKKKVLGRNMHTHW